MTTPDERQRAMVEVGKFLFRLIDSKATPRVPMAVRREAHQLAKHYPILFEARGHLIQSDTGIRSAHAGKDRAGNLDPGVRPRV